ncbi:hypothetical protein HWHPT5561_00980 [Petrotoga sp. HWH.PT.55.6.1]|uniref:hypothetical protein n=1 Tax=unclassified Petrotoga TaxID=2620614 RepID=UPI000CA08413|nr:MULTISPECIES: hypothetical protein [unclassified Petrotoga]PNR91068.1 hypothetical protein X926_09475 [Petrotoga sp. HWHPT.55.6.3]RPD36428.1 hypothetical protein HWHPT5561_00980 [Petrotoga sp. HWH.PT.55.6.1]
MKKIGVSLFAVIVLTAVVFSAPLGLGVKVGEPTGLYIRSYSSNTSFAGITAAWSFANDSFLIDSDFNALSPNLFGDIGFSYGGGLHVGVASSELSVGVRMPLALNFEIPSTPLLTFLELAPGFNVIPETKFNLSGGLGFGYIF